MEPALTWQPDTDTFLRNNSIGLCGNDYSPGPRYAVRNLFAPPNATNADPRPVFVAINCVSNSPSHAHRQILVNDFSNGGGSFNFNPDIVRWRNIIDSVKAPPPRITGAKRVGDSFEFVVPGQRGRTNRIEATTDFAEWTTITNLFGTNAAITIRDTNASVNPSRSYRIVRP